MPHPYQCIAEVTPTERSTFLLAACGPKLVSSSLKDGAMVSQWTSESAGTAPVASNGVTEGDSERPAKKQKTTARATPTLTNILKIVVSPDQQHAVVITEDKCVRVFTVEKDGSLVELSQRTMPKRPCAVQVLPDNDTIMIGDKHGDIYSLPILPTDEGEKAEKEVREAKAQQAVEMTFKSSATPLTVHSQRNLKALEAQQKQKLFTPRKEALAFEHKLLLGHVSMLTDALHTTREVDGKKRSYIISADRDEHIRISRGIPQSHVIEGFCLGHEQFISKICVVPGTDLLISGGGDDWLGVWDWPSLTLKRKFNVRPYFQKCLDEEPYAHIAISGIWTVPVQNQPGDYAVVIACEKAPALCVISAADLAVDSELASDKATVLSTAGRSNPIDVLATQQGMLVSVDAREGADKRIAAYNVKLSEDGKIVCTEDSTFGETSLQSLNSLTGVEEDPKTTDALLYSIRNFRKRGPLEEPQEAQD